MNNFSWKQATYCAKLSMYAYQDEAGFRKVIEKDGLDIKSVSYTHLTLPTNREV